MFAPKVLEITITVEIQTWLRGLGATLLAQTGQSRESSAILRHAQVQTVYQHSKYQNSIATFFFQNQNVMCSGLKKSCGS